MTRLREEGGNGEMRRIRLDGRQAGSQRSSTLIHRERTDEYGEIVESTRQFHEESFVLEGRRGRTT